MKNADRYRKEVVQLTRDMVRIKSVNPPGREREMAEYVGGYLNDLGIDTKTVQLDDEQYRRSVVGRIPGKNNGSIVLCGHLDTVDVTEEHWSVPAFEAIVRDERIYGRGSADMKGALAVMLVVAKLIMESDRELEQDVGFAFTADEESGYRGASSLVKEGFLNDAKILVITEPTDGEVFIGEKGELWMKTTFYGKAAHGSTPESGMNAVLLASDFSLKLDSKVKDFPDDELLGMTTLNIGQLNGGWQVNIVPDKAVVKMDFRVIKNEHKQLALDTINELANELVGDCGGEYEMDVLSYQKPIVSDANEIYIKNFLKAADGGDSVEMSSTAIVPYCTDASVIVPELGVPLVICGPGKIEMAHQPDEYIEIDSLVEVLSTFASFFEI